MFTPHHYSCSHLGLTVWPRPLMRARSLWFSGLGGRAGACRAAGMVPVAVWRVAGAGCPGWRCWRDDGWCGGGGQFPVSVMAVRAPCRGLVVDAEGRRHTMRSRSTIAVPEELAGALLGVIPAGD